MRGKKRQVVEVLTRDREAGGYRFSLRLSCGHSVRQASARTSKDYTPTVGYCCDPECIMDSRASRLAERGRS